MALREAFNSREKETFDDKLSLSLLKYMKERIERAMLLEEPTVTFDVGNDADTRWAEKLSSSQISRRVRIIGHFLEEIGVPYTYGKSCGVDTIITIFTHHLFL